jgi:hypothetical protein
MNRLFVFAALCVLALAARPAHAGVLNCATLGGSNLVTNCGFETGNANGWSLSGDLSYTGVNAEGAHPHSGSYQLDFGSTSGVAYMWQDITTSPGSTYDLYFWLSNEGGTPASFAVRWNGNTLYSETNAPSYGYTAFDFSNLTPSAGSTTQLEFIAEQVPNFYHLDDVQVTVEGGGSTPEPGTLGLMGGGLAIAAALRRRLRRA